MQKKMQDSTKGRDLTNQSAAILDSRDFNKSKNEIDTTDEVEDSRPYLNMLSYHSKSVANLGDNAMKISKSNIIDNNGTI